jgi:hypothetical protein
MGDRFLLKGFTKLSLVIVAFAVIFAGFYLYVLPVLSAGINVIGLLSPGNNT